MEKGTNIFQLDAEQLVPVENINLFINANQMSLCNFYNKDGGLVLTSDRRIPEILKQKTLYVSRAAYEAILPKTDRPVIIEKRPSSFSEKIKENYKFIQDEKTVEKAEKQFGQKTVQTVAESLDRVEEVFNAPKMGKKEFSRVTELVNETYSMDRLDLSGCINALRNVDDYTYNHSFGVYLLFSEALEEFKKFKDRPIFYDVFKTLNNNVNFNMDSLKKYATAALLHDYGKRSIPSKILGKDSKLTNQEMDIVRYHPKLGVKAFQEMGVTDSLFLEIVGNHHRDYLTFPRTGQSPLAQICNILDIYEACRSKRIYKDPQTFNETQNILLSEVQNPNSPKWDSFIFVTILKEVLPRFESRRLAVD